MGRGRRLHNIRIIRSQADQEHAFARASGGDDARHEVGTIICNQMRNRLQDPVYNK